MQSSCSGVSNGGCGVLFSDKFVQQRSLPNGGTTYPASFMTKNPHATNSNCKDILRHVPPSTSQIISHSKTGASATTSNGKQPKRPSSIANLSGDNKAHPNISQLRQQSLPASLTKSKGSKLSTSSISQSGSNSHKARQNRKLMSGPSLTSLHLARRDQQRWQQSIPSKSSPKQPLLNKRLGITSQMCVRDRGSVQRKLSFGNVPLHTDAHRSSSALEKTTCGSEVEITQVQFDLDKLPKVERGSRKSSISTLGSTEFEEASLFPDSRAHCQCKDCRDAKLWPKLKRRSIEVHLPTTSLSTSRLKKPTSCSANAASHSNCVEKRHPSSRNDDRQSRTRKSPSHQARSVRRESSRIRKTSSLSSASDDGKFNSSIPYC